MRETEMWMRPVQQLPAVRGVPACAQETLPSTRMGLVTEDAFDLDLEQQMLLRLLHKFDNTAAVVGDREFQSELDQEMAFTLLRKKGEPAVYEADRRDLIRCPPGPVDELPTCGCRRWSRIFTGTSPTTRPIEAGGFPARSGGGPCGSPAESTREPLWERRVAGTRPTGT